MSSSLQIYLFDIDGTLLLSGGAGRAALADGMLAAFGLDVRRDIDLHGRTDRWIAQQLLTTHGLADSDENWRLLRRAYLRALPCRLRERTGRVLPGALELLRLLGDEPRAAVGLLTGNVRQGADIKLRHFALDAYVGSHCFGGFGDDHDCRNRVAADALASAQAAVGQDVDPRRVWVIGDTPRDIDCARAIGVRAAAVATGGYSRDQLAERRPDVLLDSLEEAEELLS